MGKINTLNKIYSASSSYGNYPPSNAFDGDSTTSWSGSNSINYFPNQYISIDLGNPIDIAKISLIPDYPIKSISLQYNDVSLNSTYITAQSFSLQQNCSEQNFIVNSVGKHQYWRIKVIANYDNSNPAGFKEIKLYSSDYFLIQDNNQIKSSSDGINLTYVDNLPYNIDKFNDDGITNLSNITPTIINKLVGPKYNIALLK